MRLFVTGTDTDAGKTIATACLASAARSLGSTLAAKPVASGVPPGTSGQDAELIARAAGHAPLCFASYEAPLSPHRAALLEGATLDGPALLAFVRSLQADTVIVEGVGGWRVPLGGSPLLWVADLARAHGGPVVVVAPDRLGAINHTLLTVERVLADGFQVALVALNRGTASASSAPASNEADLRELLAPLGVPLGVLPPVDPADERSLREAGLQLFRAIDRAIVKPETG